MNSLVIYMDETDEICISYAREIGGKIHVLKYGKNSPSTGIIYKGEETLEDIKKFGGIVDILIFRKNTPIGRKILYSLEELKGLKLLIIN